MTFRSLLPFSSRELSRGGDPFSAMQREINRMFDDVWRGSASGGPVAQRTALSWAPSVDVKDDKEQLRVVAELPGVDEKDVNVTLDGDVLTISGVKRDEHEEKDDKGNWVMTERSFGSFSRSFTLPFVPTEGGVEADFAKGVLRITIRKPAPEDVKSRSIPIKGS
jgi:HSP20 family protein